MRIIDLASVPHRTIDANDSAGFQVGAFGVIGEAHLVMVRLRPGGVVGRHPAAARQLLVVLDGDAVVSGDGDGIGGGVPIGPGEAALWEAYESHETRSVNGLTALVVEGELDLGEPGHHVDPGDV